MRPLSWGTLHTPVFGQRDWHLGLLEVIDRHFISCARDRVCLHVDSSHDWTGPDPLLVGPNKEGFFSGRMVYGYL